LIWDLATRTVVGEPLTGHAESVTAIAISEFDGQPVAATCSRDRTVLIWDLQARVPREALTLPGEPVAVAFSGNKTMLVATRLSCFSGLGIPLRMPARRARAA